MVPGAADDPRLMDDLLGEDFALLATAHAPLSPALHASARALDARVIHLHDPRRRPGTGGAELRAEAGTSALVRWMGTAGAVLLRPDRVVLATAAPPRPGRTCGDDLAAAAAAWAPMLCGSGSGSGSGRVAGNATTMATEPA